jgi:hypothetical protein
MVIDKKLKNVECPTEIPIVQFAMTLGHAYSLKRR